MTSATVVHRLIERAGRTPRAPAFLWREPAGTWHSEDWGGVLARVRNTSLRLRALGVNPGDRVVLMMPTSPRWEYAHLAALAAGAVVAGVDAHDSDENLRHILAAVSPQAVFAGDAQQLDRLRALLPRPVAITVLGCGAARGAHELEALSQPGANAASEDASAWALCHAEMPATIVFTSGSTGKPKGIEYTHGQLGIAVDAILACFPDVGAQSRLACWLPLSNLFQRIIDLCAISCGAQTWFVDPPTEIAARLPEIRPALFVGVPRFFEKLHAGILEELARRPLPVRWLAGLAWEIGVRFRRARRAGQLPGALQRWIHAAAERLVLRRLREAVTGDALRFMVSGSAPFPPWLLDRLHGIGWLVLEAYGISENVVPVALNVPGAYRFGSVGRPVPGSELRFAPDGELLVRGPGVFRGYLGSEAAEGALDGDGFLHTGDFARLDPDGYLWLTGRKSEVFKTSTGRRVAPAAVEAALKRLPYVEHAMVTGAGRPVPVAILSVAPRALAGRGDAALAEDIAKVCADLPEAARIAGAVLTERPFTIAAGELTANLKLRRKPIEAEHAGALDALYQALAARGAHGGCLVQRAG
ncbi:MAG: AMP-dependent synthetase/ligase [Rhodocyclaceae bacterium]